MTAERTIHKKILHGAAVLICLAGLITGCAKEKIVPSEHDMKAESEKLERDIGLLCEEVATLQKQFDSDINLLRQELNDLAEKPAGLGYNDICERSPKLQDTILRELQLPSCQIVSERELLRITKFTVSAEELWPGDLDGLRNLETLRLYLNSPPPEDLLSDAPNLVDLTLEHGGICGKFAINGKPVEVSKSGENCRATMARH